MQSACSPLSRKILAHRDAGVRREELERRGLGRGRDDDDRVVHRAVGRACRPPARRSTPSARWRRTRNERRGLLVDDRVDGDRRLAGLTVTDDELALTATDRDHGVDGLDPGLQRLLHRLATDDARRLDLDAARFGSTRWALAVDRLPERVDDAAEHRVTHRHAGDAARALDGVAFLDAGRLAEHGDADVVLLEVQHEPEDRARELARARRP